MSTTISPQTPEAGNGIPLYRMEPWGQDFSGDYYFDLVDTLQADRDLYTFEQAAELVEVESKVPIGLLRHDIDQSPVAAEELARLEHERGIKATYFIIPNSEHYDISAPKTVQSLGRIANIYGHEVGLHYNPNVQRRQGISNIHELEADVKDQAAQLERAIGVDIKSVSFHEPGDNHQSWMNGPLRLAGLVNAYAAVFMSPEASAMYATDSGGTWRYGEPAVRVKQAIQAKAQAIQVLTHAEWWQLKA